MPSDDDDCGGDGDDENIEATVLKKTS